MWNLILSFLGGPIVNGLIQAYQAKLASVNQKDQAAVDLAKSEIQGEITNRQTEASIIRQENGWWLTALPRPLFAFIFVIYIGKCVVYDKVLGLGTTDPLGPELNNIEMIIITGYFSTHAIDKISRIFKK